MKGVPRLLAFMALACARPALLAPISRWALSRLRTGFALPIRTRARARPAARRGRPGPGARRAGPRPDRRGARRSLRRDSVVYPRWW